MDQSIRSIVIVGGGTAGWLSAVFLNRMVGSNPAAPCQITLIESSDIGTVGVGEATVPTLRNTFKACGIDEADWMAQCNASFKLAIRFVNWSGAGAPDVYWHPFGGMPYADGFPLSYHWLQRRLQGMHRDFADACSVIPRLCATRRAPRPFDSVSSHSGIPYAYHLDAGLLATYLKHVGVARGVHHIVDTVSNVVLDADGCIDYLRTGAHGNLYGDLFIDCSGFRGLLINGALAEPFISFGDVLFCDRAIALPTPYEVTDTPPVINPYTTATALSAGWMWNTPLFSRNGNGYVYSSAFQDEAAAEEEFLRVLGRSELESEPRHIRMRVGRTRNAWVKNCISIGLSSGFIEPLESTGIWFIELALYNLVMNFPDRHFEPGLQRKYNHIMQRYYEEIRDFIVLHYCTTIREDTPFWRLNKYHPEPPDSLRDKLATWQATLPSHEKLEDPGFFKDMSYVSVLAGMNRLPTHNPGIIAFRDAGLADQLFQQIEQDAERLAKTLPDHYQYLSAQKTGCPST